jgi:hypothetical protein
MIASAKGGRMQTAAKILIVGGISNLAYAVLIGFALARARSATLEVPRYLVLSHTGPLMQGIMLLALSLALPLSDLSTGIETLAAWLLVASAASIGLGDTLNWRQGVRDPFAEKPIGYYLAVLTSITGVGGIGILLAGVVRGV